MTKSVNRRRAAAIEFWKMPSLPRCVFAEVKAQCSQAGAIIM